MENKTEPQSSPLANYLPILGWLPKYDRSWLTVDIIAGLTLWGLVVPEAMAYAGIAGLPPQAGLYTLLASLFIYALLGTSRHLVVQATSATAALLASSVAAALVATAAATASDPETYQAYASAFVLVTGVVFLAGGRSAMAVNALAKAGFTQVYNIIDGFEGDKVDDPESIYHGMRMRNGWKISAPWTYKLDPTLVWLPSEAELDTLRKTLDL